MAIFAEATVCICTFVDFQTLLAEESSAVHESENVGAPVEHFVGGFELSARRKDQFFQQTLLPPAHVSLADADLKLEEIFDDRHLADRVPNNPFRPIASPSKS